LLLLKFRLFRNRGLLKIFFFGLPERYPHSSEDVSVWAI
jgi:hypothetical protein